MVTRQQTRTVAAAVGLGVGGFGVAGVVVFVAATLLLSVGVPVTTEPSLRLAVSVVMGQGVAFGGFALAYLALTDRDLNYVSARVPTLRDVAWILGGFVLMFAALVALSVLFTALGLDPAENEIARIGAQNPDVFLLLVPLSFLLIGPGEELLYRGVVQARLRETFGPTVAIPAASAIFAAIHVFSLVGSGVLVTLTILFVLSLVFGVAYERTANLVVPAVIHGAFNAVQFLRLYVATSGADLAELL